MTESLFWSESFKSLPLLYSLKPLVIDHSENNTDDLLRTIEDYFKKGSSAFLEKQL